MKRTSTMLLNLKNSEKLAGFTNKMMIFMLALFEGNNDKYVLSKVSTYFSPELLFNRMKEIYGKYYRINKKLFYKNPNK